MLITLGVIGVVAALTMPTLIANYQKKVMVERLKTTYSIISQAVRMSEVDNGPVAEWEIPHGVNSTEAERMDFGKKYFKPYLKNVKECTSFGACLGETDSGSYYAVILNNGVVCRFYPHGGQKATVGDDIQVYVDINGKQKPNQCGKDRFIIVVDAGTTIELIGKNQGAGKVYFWGQGRDIDTLKNHNTYGCLVSGDYCGAWIMESGWKIPEDYPW